MTTAADAASSRRIPFHLRRTPLNSLLLLIAPVVDYLPPEEAASACSDTLRFVPAEAGVSRPFRPAVKRKQARGK
jgi:hypothetical protein